MSSSLFSKSDPRHQQQPANDLQAAVEQVKRAIGNQDPTVVLRQLCASDPQVRQFVSGLQGLTPMQLAAKFFKK